MRIGLYQFAPEFAKTEKNIRNITEAVKRSDADILVFPEMALSGYLFTSREEVRRAAVRPDGPWINGLREAADKQGCYVVIGLPELSDDGFYNSAVLIGPDGHVGTYRKVHLFYEEKSYFGAGNLGFPVFRIKGLSLGILICFDHMYPEAARCLALQGVEVICHPSNLVLPEYGQLTTRVRSIENRVFWILANRTGSEERGGKRLAYTGCSQITAPDGKILTQAGEKEEELLTVEIDPSSACDKRVTPLDDLFSDRRTDVYSRYLDTDVKCPDL